MIDLSGATCVCLIKAVGLLVRVSGLTLPSNGLLYFGSCSKSRARLKTASNGSQGYRLGGLWVSMVPRDVHAVGIHGLWVSQRQRSWCTSPARGSLVMSRPKTALRDVCVNIRPGPRVLCGSACGYPNRKGGIWELRLLSTLVGPYREGASQRWLVSKEDQHICMRIFR